MITQYLWDKEIKHLLTSAVGDMEEYNPRKMTQWQAVGMRFNLP